MAAPLLPTVRISPPAMRSRILALPIAFVMLAALLAPVPAHAATASRCCRVHYSGKHHSGSHGGRYSGGRGSSHKGGHYSNPRTGNRYGTHRR